MAIVKCKMCGNEMEVEAGASFCICDYCDTKQTVPRERNENLLSLFNRANVLRRRSEFDKAAEIYEKILQRNESEAEAYWGLILCKYGIEYVEDPETCKRVPTCHRVSYDAVVSDEDYRNAIRYADDAQRSIYEAEAKAIDEIQRGILALAQKEAPYDVFICYKERDDASGQRTTDSVLANDIYYQLKKEGFKVFYAAITLEDKLGKEYEPYIFSALNTAKVMLVIGTKPEYFRAVWVRNEWSRFLKIMKKKRDRQLIPCYRDMDPYDMPEEFAHLQAQDMSKIGFINDLARGIGKIVRPEAKQTRQGTAGNSQTGASTADAKKVLRGNMALKDLEWEEAEEFFEAALDQNPECAEAYIGKMLAEKQLPDLSTWLKKEKEKYSGAEGSERLEACPEDTAHISEMVRRMTVKDELDADTIRKQYAYDRTFESVLPCRKKQKEEQLRELDSERYLSWARQYASGETKTQLENAIREITETLDQRIADAEVQANADRVKTAYAEHLARADRTVAEWNRKALEHLEERYQKAAVMLAEAVDISSYGRAKDAFLAMKDYKDCRELAARAEQEIKRLKEEQLEALRRQRVLQKQEEEHREAAGRQEKERQVKPVKKWIAAALVVCLAGALGAGKFMSSTGDKSASVQQAASGNDVSDQENDISAKWNGTEVGDVISFGTYEQDKDSSNVEAIEWIVLEKEEDRMLVLSRYGLDCQRYHNSEEVVTWETSAIRQWLNEDFLKAAFSDEEEEQILETKVTADPNPVFNTDPGNDTTDKIFLLSISEVEQYLPSMESKQCEPTDYAVEHGTYIDGGIGMWWLRSPGMYGSTATIIEAGVDVDYESNGVINANVIVDDVCVRPALWIRLKDSAEEETEREDAGEGKEASGQGPEILSDWSQEKEGNLITFGTYEQDNDLTNGEEAIEWIVLKKEEDRMLVLSRYGLEPQPYHESWEDVTWETSTVRQWLNGDFLKAAFSDTEAERILETRVTADPNPEYDTDPGNDTTDKLFLLSILGVEQYLTTDESRQCEPTADAVKGGAYISGGNCWWWLRSPGANDDYAACVLSGGMVVDNIVYSDDVCVRPALWIDLKS